MLGIEYLDCPFCGSRDIHLRETTIGRQQQRFYYLVCGNCRVKTDTYPSRAKALDAWNMRQKDVLAEGKQDV